MAKLKPLAGYVLIEPIDDEEKTASGLIMPEKAKEKPAKGKVMAVGKPIIHYEVGRIHIPGVIGGPDFPEEECPVKVGDTVIFHRWSGQDVKEGQKEYKLVKFSDLMAFYE
mgnify:CR=1 FL=1